MDVEVRLPGNGVLGVPAGAGGGAGLLAALGDPVRVADALRLLAGLAPVLGPALAALRPPAPAGWGRAAPELEALFGPAVNQPRTWSNHRLVLRLWREACPAGPHQLTAAALAGLVTAWRAAVAPVTVNTRLRTLRAQANALERLGMLPSNPFKLRGWIGHAEPSRPDRWQPAAKVERLLLRADQEWERAHRFRQNSKRRAGRLRALVYLLAHTGLRAKEALHVRWQDLDLGARTLRVGEAIRTKTAASRATIPLPPPVVPVLAEWRPWCAAHSETWVFPQWSQDKPWTGGGTSCRPLGAVKALGERAGVANLTLLSFRHSFATHAAGRWGWTEIEIQQVLRHTSTRTQRGYRHTDVGNLRAAAERVGFRGTGGAGAAPAAAP